MLNLYYTEKVLGLQEVKVKTSEKMKIVFRQHEDKAFRKELIENLTKYCFDHMSLLTVALLLKKKFTIEEVINNYYSNVDAFGYDMF